MKRDILDLFYMSIHAHTGFTRNVYFSPQLLEPVQEQGGLEYGIIIWICLRSKPDKVGYKKGNFVSTNCAFYVGVCLVSYQVKWLQELFKRSGEVRKVLVCDHN